MINLLLLLSGMTATSVLIALWVRELARTADSDEVSKNASRLNSAIWVVALITLMLYFRAGYGLSLGLLLGSVVALIVWLVGLKAGSAELKSVGFQWWWQITLIFVLRTFVYEPYQIPSSSMERTLEIGDYILVNRHLYGLSFPELNIAGVQWQDPEAGDVAVFNSPSGKKGLAPTLIKRIVGLPGDIISVNGPRVFVNGRPLAEEEVEVTDRHLHYVETLGDVSYRVKYRRAVAERVSGTWQVPDGHYFVMGDNRDNSFDSRYWGFVSRTDFVGKAERVWMHWPSFSELPSFASNRELH